MRMASKLIWKSVAYAESVLELVIQGLSLYVEDT